MENASKALIIAGAILLSIAIIGIGMYVYNMASSTIQGANMSAQEIEAYNAEFVKYEGTQTGSTVKALCDTVRSHNLTNNDDASKQIILQTSAASDGNDSSTGSTSSAITTIKNGINSGTRYTVSFGYSSTGLIKTIGVVVNTGRTGGSSTPL